MPLYLGGNQVAECMRSGQKCLASELVRDGRNPQLLVLPQWADPAHPQEHPFIPDDVEGVADYPQAPDNLPTTGILLSGYYTNTIMALSWTQARLWGPRAKTYNLRRSVDGAAYTNLSIQTVDYTNATNAIPNIGLQKDYGNVYSIGSTTYNDSVVAGVAPGSSVLLLHMDGLDNGTTFTDSSLTGNIMTATGLAKTATAAAKFGATGGKFSSAVQVGAAYVRTPISVGSALDLTSGDFTVEGWFYPPSAVVNGLGVIFSASNLHTSGVRSYITSTGAIVLQFFGAYSASSILSPNAAFGQWHHFAVTRQGTNWKIFVDGVLGPGAYITLGAGSTGTAGDYFWVGADDLSAAQSTWWNGYLDEIRVTKGVARYIANFTPPTAPFTPVDASIYVYQVAAVDDIGDDVAVSNTVTLDANTGIVTGSIGPYDPYFSSVVALLHLDGTQGSTSFPDSSPYANTYTSAFGSGATVDTAIKKFGTGSLKTAGSGFVRSNMISAYQLSNNKDYTVEGWFYTNTVSASGSPLVLSAYPSTQKMLFIQVNPGGKLAFNSTNSTGSTPIALAGPTTVSATTWHHFAAVRSGNNFYLFLDGTLEASGTAAMVYGTHNNFLDLASNQPASIYLDGYIDDFRFTNGVARYTANFSVFQAPFPNSAS
jgi:hypothetical protein